MKVYLLAFVAQMREQLGSRLSQRDQAHQCRMNEGILLSLELLDATRDHMLFHYIATPLLQNCRSVSLEQ